MTQPRDQELVRQTRTGDHKAYKELVARYQGHVYGLAYSLVGDWTDAQDIAQETFIRAYVNIDQLKDPSRFAGWLRRVAFSVAMNWLKAFRPKLFEQVDGRVDLDHLDIPDFRPGPPEVVEKRDLAEAVLKAVESLPQKYRVPLTMFHLDGLSYRKVADFLDIPLGTAKSLIYRAKEKLKPALSAYAGKDITPAVQEVFNEHKLPKEFTSKVLNGIDDLDYRKQECTFTGSVLGCMKYLNENVSPAFIKGVSGGAFKLLWYLKWCPSNNTLFVLGTEPVERTFRALGYEYQFIRSLGYGNQFDRKPNNEDDEERIRKKITESIEKGCPVIVEGIIGPPECGIVAGYDKGGKMLLGRSYFHKSDDYYQKDDWYKDCYSLVLIGEKKEQPPTSEILRDSLQWAVELARMGKWSRIDGAEYACGLAAYDAWAEALKKDEDFPEGNLETLKFRCHVHSNVTYCGLIDARKAASIFLKSMASVNSSATEGILAAAAAYDDEIAMLGNMVDIAPYSCQPEECLHMADPKLRRNIAKLIVEAKSKDEIAVKHPEQVLKTLKS